VCMCVRERERERALIKVGSLISKVGSSGMLSADPAIAPQHGLHCEHLGTRDVELNMETVVKGERGVKAPERGGGREEWRARTG